MAYGKQWLGVIFIFLAVIVMSLSSAVTFVYDESDLVRLVPEASDFDDDNITFAYSAPLDEKGEWQTDYDDAGTYETVVTAFDGKDTTEEAVTIIINNVNRAPEIEVDDAEFIENDLVDIQLDVSDPDNDDVSVTFSEPLDENGRWQTDFDSAGDYKITVKASDAVETVEATFTLTIVDKNRGPRIISTLPDVNIQQIDETEEISFFVEAIDEDGDALHYVWFVDDVELSDEEEFVYVSDYDSAGTHEIVLEVSDGEEILTDRWTVEVENVNRAPTLEPLDDVTIDEGELFVLDLPDVDVDGDELTYIIDEPLASGEWTPTFDDAGMYVINVFGSDGELSDEKVFTLTVDDIDRAPEFAEIGDITLRENEDLNIPLSVVDPDGDDVSFSITGLEGAVAENYEVTWRVDYDFIALPQHFFARLLSRLRIDRFVYKPERLIIPVVTACGKDKCTNQTFKLLVQNVNRAPVMEALDDFTVNEGDEVIIEPRASDPDNEFVRFRFSDPIWWTGKWQTDFEDAGEYAVTVTAGDGKVSVEENVTVFVENVNRIPEFGRLTDKTVNENETLSFEIPVSDDDGDDVTLIAEDLPAGSVFSDGVFTWTPDHEIVSFDEGIKEFLVTFGLTDDFSQVNITTNVSDNVMVKKSILITVLDVNRPPVINMTLPNATSIALVGQPVIFNVNAFDPDGNELSYQWTFGLFDSIKGHTAIRRKFSSVGEREIKVTVSDGEFDETFTWDVRVGRLRRRVVEG